MLSRDNTVIIVFGNLASGKTTVCKALLKHLHDFSFISADNVRMKFENDFNFKNESLARTIYESELMISKNVIWETTLSGKFSRNIASKLSQTHNVVKCKIDADPATCLKRFLARPIPTSTVRKDIKENIYSIDEVLQTAKADIYIDSTKFHPSVIALMIKNYYDAISSRS